MPTAAPVSPSAVRTRLGWAIVCLLAVLPGRAPAAPADEVLRLVPPDTALCVVVRDLRGHLRGFAESPFAGWLRESQLGKLFADPKDVEKFKALQGFLADQIGVTGEQLVEDVLGDAIVLAYQPGPPGKPEQERGLILVRARKPETLATVVDRLNKLQQKSGEIKAVRDKAHRDQRYVEREKADGGREFYLLRDGILAFSGQEEAVRGVIDRQADGSPNRVAAGLERLGLADKHAVCWFNPRAFDAELGAQAEAAKDPGERAFLAQFRRVWAATDGLALYAHPGKGLELGVAAAVDRGKLPKEVRDVLLPTPGGAALWSAVPPDAILAVGGRIDVPKVLAAVGSFLPPDGSNGLKAAVEQGLGPLVGKDKLPTVLAGLGPDWAVWIAPPVDAETWVPRWTAALKLSGDSKGEVGRAVLQAVDYAVQTARLAYNQAHADQAELADETRDGLTVKYLANEKGFPPGFRPAYAVKDGHLVLAGSPDEVRRFAAPSAGIGVSDPPLLRFSAVHLRRYLLDHKKDLAAAVGAWSKRSATAVEGELSNLAAVLEVFDRVEVHYRGENGVVRLTMHVEFVKPLAK